MAPKRNAEPCEIKTKRQRKKLAISDKVKVLDMLKEGVSNMAVGRHFGINESSVRCIKKEEKNIRKTASLNLANTTKRVMKERNKSMVKMENALSLWITHCRKNEITLNTNMIQSKALILYNVFATEEGTDLDKDNDQQPGASSDLPLKKKKPFVASKGWFDKFQKRFGLKSVSTNDETIFTNTEAAEFCITETIQEYTNKGDQISEQILNTDKPESIARKTKRKLSKTFIFKDETKATRFAHFLDEKFPNTSPESSNDVADYHEGLEETKKSTSIKKEEKPEQDQGNDTGLTLERLAILCSLSKELQEKAVEWDNNVARSLQFFNDLDRLMSPYKNILSTKIESHLSLKEKDAKENCES